MSMIQLAPGFSVRDDIAATHELCQTCHGRTTRWAHIAGYLWSDGFSLWEAYRTYCQDCAGRGIIRTKLLCEVVAARETEAPQTMTVRIRQFCENGRKANAEMLERGTLPDGWPLPAGWGRLYCPICGGGTPDTGCRLTNGECADKE